MKFTKLLAYPIWPEAINVIWELDNTQLNGDYKFRVFLEWQDVSGLLFNKYNFIIRPNEPILYSEFRQTLSLSVYAEPPYLDMRQGVEPVQKTINLYHELQDDEFYKAMEIVRKENLRFEVKIGIPVYVLKRKMFGPICTQCIDTLTGTITNSQCLDCYGTGYMGGYYEPVRVWGEITENPVIKQVGEVSTGEEKTSVIRLTNEVLVSKKDLVVDILNNNRWVVSSEPTMVKYRAYPISQQATAYMVSPKSVLNKIELEI